MKNQIKQNKNFVGMKKEVLKTILTKIISHGSATYSPLLDKDYSGTSNIAIAPFPERSQTFEGQATEKIVSDYCEKNNDLFIKHFAFGAWLDKGSAKTYLDVVAPIPLEKQPEAVVLGRNANQIAGFNLYDFSEIPLGGTGEFNSSVIPFGERLREASMLIG